ncbi:mechanosensitive ion channel protein [Agarivorans sp. OAG1]|uniref:Small-conductance mechanosensitive channel n=1 Tax=Agarivorans albus MKT 106 TaxID=1331007 RepID=R9PGN6_AGAAL|nr:MULTISPECIES: small-conductance mechanosensitive channel MscS [Agarivorans]MPW31276.1 small-conductance mechanosensitive channel MscS [Agarivorans sp. B2Z047]UQN42759.1 small-conductance mechanosensitive channel MscS [Agarivorans sp. B2Z047]BEU05289.1 mechanosensitive ion channel protein [Agarivorans sp. OAG1]GAD00388.1 potassium efflux system KefA protein [Agarivorans albus MKT 106]
MDVFTEGTSWFENNQDLLMQYAINIAAAIAILFVGMIVARVMASSVEKLMNARKLDTTISHFVGSMVKYIIIAFVIIAALSRIGIQTASFVAIIGAAGLAVGLALQGSLSNFAAGVLIIGFRPFKAGDFVEIAGTAGSVASVQIFTTVLKTPDNKQIVVPNGAVLGGNIVNYSTHPTRRVDLVVGVSYNADLAKTKAILREVCEADSRVLKDPDITIGVSELADSSVNLVVRPWVNSADYWGAYFDLNENIKVALDNAGIEIPFPQMDVHLDKVAS